MRLVMKGGQAGCGHWACFWSYFMKEGSGTVMSGCRDGAGLITLWIKPSCPNVLSAEGACRAST